MGFFDLFKKGFEIGIEAKATKSFWGEKFVAKQAKKVLKKAKKLEKKK